MSETADAYIGFCPFHGNFRTPSFVTLKESGRSFCFNPACAVGFEGKRMSLIDLAMNRKDLSFVPAKQLVMRHYDPLAIVKQAQEINLDKIEDACFSDEFMSAIKHDFWAFHEPVDYMHGRGFTDDTLDFFNVGFLQGQTITEFNKDMVCVPAYDHKGRPVGLVSRTIEGKSFKNFGTNEDGTGFIKSNIVWNLTNAKCDDTIILTEATFDAMMVHQAGYKNVGALLGGSLSTVQKAILRRNFRSIIIMTDNDKAGRKLGYKIAREMPEMRVRWAVYDSSHVFARDVKDASDMTAREIRQCLRNSMAHYEYDELFGGLFAEDAV